MSNGAMPTSALGLHVAPPLPQPPHVAAMPALLCCISTALSLTLCLPCPALTRLLSRPPSPPPPLPAGRVGEGVAVLMRAVAESGPAAAAPMRESALREGAALQHLQQALFAPGRWLAWGHCCMCQDHVTPASTAPPPLCCCMCLDHVTPAPTALPPCAAACAWTM